MARPTKYSKTLEDKAWKYARGGWEKEGHAVPSIVGLCSTINIGKSTIYVWSSNTDTEFQDILDHILTEQELVTFNRALTGDYNASIAKLLLGKHGYHDKQDSTLSGPNGGPIESEITVNLNFK